MKNFLDSTDAEAIHGATGCLRGWRREHQGLKVAVVYGPLSLEDQLYSTECPVEQRSSTALAESLASLGVWFKILDPTLPSFIQEVTQYDVVLSNLHGPFGEDGRLQGLMDFLRVPYCGSGVSASAVAADKILCKQVMETLRVPTPDWRVWDGEPVEWLGDSVMVKDPLGGSSVGMTLVHEEVAFAEALKVAAGTQKNRVLIESFTPGIPVTVGLLELPTGEVLIFPPLATKVHEAEFYDAETKLDADSKGTVSVAPAELDPSVLTRLIGHSKTLWDGLGLRGQARVDFMVTSTDEEYALEVNSTPGMSWGSNYVTGAVLCGLSHSDVVLAMIHEALTRRPYDVPLPAPVFTDLTSVREAAA
ncbi:ATP-grasp domain-containing protein [Streptomyces sp. NPDC091040]|uniref:D-alanine--D-alanine ligase family protein n=1 Tax=Streptomyces sp. NPDC091040 TaxID=3365972 RepID=UPI0038008AC5